MDFFHIGCRVEEIQGVCPSKSERHPTTVYLKSGLSINISGPWDKNTVAINQKLIEIERFRHQLTYEKEQKLKDLKRLDEALSSFDQSAVNPEDLVKLRNWCEGSRNYLRSTEQAALRRILGGLE